MSDRKSPKKFRENGSAREIDPTRAPAMRPRSPWAADPGFSTESYLGSIERGAPLAAAPAWTRWCVEQADRSGQRDAAICAAAGLLRQSSVSATAKRVADELRRYLAGAWITGVEPNRECDLDAPPAESSALRQNLWRIAKLTDSEGRGWRTILKVIEK